MTRIVGGSARGRRLVVPDAGTRPTSDRAREAVFSSIESIRGPWHGAVVLDLYAGSGACGLEALSRGATRVDLVELDKTAVAAITTNRDLVGGDSVSAAHVHRASVNRWLNAPPPEVRYDVVFCDPPYATTPREVNEALESLAKGDAVDTRSLVVLERSARDSQWQWREPFHGVWQRRYGEAHLWIAEVDRSVPSDPEPPASHGAHGAQ